ncbi:plasmid mobilization relaxosome protein MobC [Rubrivirga sp. F394]|uniref:Plasmid mobilization relaxosome protein MobC n=1 Tax=Rubrivirga litoralis TaxID=3075598 RepID=A0ABU3BQE4_9BACT|nr:plasmid mobilization relaxosome protein MobC [Rubrivirga sp. F394]MDT0631416.1 plasmid mobilization relaxosome protein MobC [Rubrivirga sp. F394]
MSGAEKADLRAAATEAGITVSEYVRRRSLGRPVTARADRETRVLLRRIGVNLNQLARTANTSGAAPPEAELADSLDHLRRVLTGLE